MLTVITACGPAVRLIAGVQASGAVLFAVGFSGPGAVLGAISGNGGSARIGPAPQGAGESGSAAGAALSGRAAGVNVAVGAAVGAALSAWVTTSAAGAVTASAGSSAGMAGRRILAGAVSPAVRPERLHHRHYRRIRPGRDLFDRFRLLVLRGHFPGVHGLHQMPGGQCHQNHRPAPHQGFLAPVQFRPRMREFIGRILRRKWAIAWPYWGMFPAWHQPKRSSSPGIWRNIGKPARFGPRNGTRDRNGLWRVTGPDSGQFAVAVLELLARAAGAHIVAPRIAPGRGVSFVETVKLGACHRRAARRRGHGRFGARQCDFRRRLRPQRGRLTLCAIICAIICCCSSGQRADLAELFSHLAAQTAAGLEQLEAFGLVFVQRIVLHKTGTPITEFAQLQKVFAPFAVDGLQQDLLTAHRRLAEGFGLLGHHLVRGLNDPDGHRRLIHALGGPIGDRHVHVQPFAPASRRPSRFHASGRSSAA